MFKEIEKGVAKDFYIHLTSLSWIRIEPIKDEMAKQYFTDLDEGVGGDKGWHWEVIDKKQNGK